MPSGTQGARGAGNIRKARSPGHILISSFEEIPDAARYTGSAEISSFARCSTIGSPWAK